MYLELKIITKNKESINKFLSFLFKNHKQNLIFQHMTKKKKKKMFTVLKAPHVNKVAQEQFEYKILTNQANLYSLKTLKLMFYFKNIQNKLFSNIKIELNSLFLKQNKKLKKKIINPEKFLLKYKFFYKKKNVYNNFYCDKKSLKNLLLFKKYLNLLDIFGELTYYKK